MGLGTNALQTAGGTRYPAETDTGPFMRAQVAVNGFHAALCFGGILEVIREPEEGQVLMALI